MSKFQQFWWYVGVGTVFVGLIYPLFKEIGF